MTLNQAAVSGVIRHIPPGFDISLNQTITAMGKLESEFQFTGPVGNLSAYRMRGVDKIIIRKKGGASRNKIRNSLLFLCFPVLVLGIQKNLVHFAAFDQRSLFLTGKIRQVLAIQQREKILTDHAVFVTYICNF